MPEPKENESHDDFIERCIPIVIEDGTADDPEQAVAICNSLWKESKMKNTRVVIKSQDDESAVIAGYGVVFGGEDLEGDVFSSDTDLKLDMVPSKSVFYEHTQDLPQHALGNVVKEKSDEVGLWIEAQLDKSKAYVTAVLELIEEGVIGLSSGSVGHLVRREGKNLTRWPIVEFSLTPQPAEPRTLGVEQIKALFDAAGLTPPAFSEVVKTTDAEKEGSEAETKGKEMSEEKEKEIEVVSTPEVDIEAITAKVKADLAAEAEVKAEKKTELDDYAAEAVKVARAEWEESLPAWKGGFATMDVAEPGSDDGGLKAWRHYLRTGDNVPYQKVYAEAAEKQIASKALGGQSAGSGAELVPDDFFAQVVAKRDEASAARILGATVINTSLDVVNVPIENTSVTKFVTTAEAGAVDEEDPGFATRAITVHKATKLHKISEELLMDEQANLDAFLADSFGRAEAMWENFYFVADGTGTGGPNSAVNRSGAGLTAADTNSITAAEIVELIHSLDSPYHAGGEVGFSMLNSTLGTARRLTTTDWAFRPMPNRADGRFMLELSGYPVAPTADSAAIATGAKPIVFGNWSFYFIAERMGLAIQRLDELYAGNGQIGLLGKFRRGGDVTQDEAFKHLLMA